MVSYLNCDHKVGVLIMCQVKATLLFCPKIALFPSRRLQLRKNSEEEFVMSNKVKFLARQARPSTTQDGNENKAENYSSISATNQHQLRQKMYQ